MPPPEAEMDSWASPKTIPGLGKVRQGVSQKQRAGALGVTVRCWPPPESGGGFFIFQL